jgi:hypothetical protein
MNDQRPTSLRRRLKARLSYANAMATIAVFIALGGTSYAAMKLPANSVGSSQLKDSSIGAAKLKGAAVTSPKIAKEAVNGSKIALSTLGTVPSAQVATSANDAKTLGGLSNLQIINQAKSEAVNSSRLKCPSGTTASGGACFSGVHQAAIWFEAAKICAAENMTLPGAPQLYAFGKVNNPGGSGPEWTDNALSPNTTLTITSNASGEGAGERQIFEYPGVPYHCLGYPTN